MKVRSGKLYKPLEFIKLHYSNPETAIAAQKK
jgi:hypothetical protein